MRHYQPNIHLGAFSWMVASLTKGGPSAQLISLSAAGKAPCIQVGLHTVTLPLIQEVDWERAIKEGRNTLYPSCVLLPL